MQHERPDPLDEERGIECAAANQLRPTFVSVLGYRVWLARVVNAIMRANTSQNRNET
jgi:hypothetical protein